MSERLFLSLPEDAGPGPETSTPTTHFTLLRIPHRLQWAVGSALIYREDFSADAPQWERVLPDGVVRIICDVSSHGTDPSPMILGPRTAPERVPLSGSMAGLSLALTPAAARSLIGAPIGEVAGRDVSLAELWGREALYMGERLLTAPDDGRRAEVLWSILEARLVRGPSKVVLPPAEFSTSSQPRTVNELASALRIGERRLQQRFLERIGLSPGRFLRLKRWQGLMRDLRRQAQPDWASLALEHGYYDQSHMVREFNAFTGLSPTVYKARVGSGLSKTSS